MKLKFYTLFVLIFSVGYMIAQVKFVEPEITLDYTVNDNVYFYLEMKNQGATQATFYWKLTKPKFNPAWRSQMCDLNDICYNWNHDHSGVPNNLESGLTGKMSLQLDHKSIVDSAILILCIYSDKEFTDTLDCMTIYLNIAESTSSKILKTDSDISLFPNPSSGYFRISGKQDIGKVELYNMIGKNIKTFDKAQPSYNVGDLRNGIYLVRIFDRKGQPLKVLRLKIEYKNP
jgi:hypothetical protein